MSFIDRIGPQGTSTSLSAAMTSILVLVIVHFSMIEKHSWMRGRRAAGVAKFGSSINSSRPQSFISGARLAAARGVAGARHGIAEGLVGVFRQRAAHQPLLIAHLDPAQIEHRVGH